MAINIIKLGDETLLDLSGDSVNPETLVKGYTAHNSLGELIEGTLEGISISISADGYWVIDGQKTTHKAIGEDGKTPEFKIENDYLYASYDGKDWTPLGYVKGADGITPTFKIENGELLVSYNNGSSWSSLGNVKGEDGDDGITPTIAISDDGYWVINGVKTEYKAIGVDGKNGDNGNDGVSITKSEINDDGYLIIYYSNGTSDNVGKVVGSGGGSSGGGGTVTPTFSIKSFSMNPSTTTYEIGSATNVTFSWSYSETPTSATFGGEQISTSTNSLAVNVTSSTKGTKRYTLSATSNNGSDSAYKDISFLSKIYYGVSSREIDADSVFIKNLSNYEWETKKNISFLANCGQYEYIWIAYPKRLGTAIIKSDGFRGGFIDAAEVPYYYIDNNTELSEVYYVYRSEQKNVQPEITIEFK